MFLSDLQVGDQVLEEYDESGVIEAGSMTYLVLENRGLHREMSTDFCDLSILVVHGSTWIALPCRGVSVVSWRNDYFRARIRDFTVQVLREGEIIFEGSS